MSFPRASVFALVVALVAPQAFAQDDLFVPIPQETKSKSKAGKQRACVQEGRRAKKSAPAPEDGRSGSSRCPPRSPPRRRSRRPRRTIWIVPMPTKKPATAKKPVAPVDDDLIVPMTVRQGRAGS